MGFAFEESASCAVWRPFCVQLCLIHLLRSAVEFGPEVRVNCDLAGQLEWEECVRINCEQKVCERLRFLRFTQS